MLAKTATRFGSARQPGAGFSLACRGSARSQLVTRRNQVAHAAAEEPAPESSEQSSVNAASLSVLAARIQQIREAQAIHMLQHRYTPSEVYEFVDMALETRPELGATTHAELTDWHEQQWAQLKAAMEGGEEHN